MNKTYERWVRGFLAALLAALALCGGVVYTVDPCFHYRMPEGRLPVFFNERYQTAGIIRQSPAEAVLVGSSMVSNYRGSWIEDIYGCPGLRVTIPDGHFSEFSQVMDLLFRENPPKRVLFALDLNALVRDDGEDTRMMPDYLYNENPLDDIKYLFNKDCMYYSVYALLAGRRGGGQALDEGFAWGTVWGRAWALENYQRPPQSDATLAGDAYLEDAGRNLTAMGKWFLEHPDTAFDVYLSPYSILAWDKAMRQGDLDARLAAVKLACETLADYENVRFFAPLLDRELITDLDNYCDQVHHSGETGRLVLSRIAAGDFRLTAENAEKTLAQWREFVVHYDYESLWDETA